MPPQLELGRGPGPFDRIREALERAARAARRAWAAASESVRRIAPRLALAGGHMRRAGRTTARRSAAAVRRFPAPSQRAVLIAGAATWVFVGVTWQTCGLRGCPDPADLVAYQPAAAPVLLDRDGEVFTRLMPVDRAVVSLDSLPAFVVDAFIAVEDRRFYQHDGVDWRRVFGAALANVRAGGYDEGASTITMQLARNLFPDRLPARSRTMQRKLSEARVAQAIERRFEKYEILELYLNHIYFGDGAYGVDAAARAYFGHRAAELSVAEAATLAAMVRAPNHYDPRERPAAVRPRRDLVLALMGTQGLLDPQLVIAAAETPIETADKSEAAASAPSGAYFIERVRDLLEARFGEEMYGTGLRVRTTIDPLAQAAAERELAAQLSAIEGGRYGTWRSPRYGDDAALDASGTPYLQGAVVVMEAATGDVLALVGGRDHRQSRFDRAATGRRQVGSAFKPFVYAAALQHGFAPSQPIMDAPFAVRLDRNRTWEPENYEGGYDGLITMRDALVRSRNIPTVRLAQALGIEPIIHLAQGAGIEEAMEPNPSLALGTPSVTPLELTAAYTAFANLGTRVEPRFITSVEDSTGQVRWRNAVAARPAVDPAVAYVLTDMLRDVVDRGTGTAVRSAGFWGEAAGKTGTTSEAKDTWFVGYTPHIVASVWIGFDQPRPILARASGGALAAPVWGRLMREIAGDAGRAEPWQPPDDVVFRYVDPASGMVLAQECETQYGEIPVREAFLRGSVPDSFCPRRPELGGWISRFFGRVFRGRRYEQERSWDATPVTARDHTLGARVLPGTVDGGAETDASRSARNAITVLEPGERRVDIGSPQRPERRRGRRDRRGG